jgi:hypothetical protein
MPTSRLEDEQGQWLTNIQLNAPAWKPGDRIPRGRDSLEVLEVRYEDDPATLVVRSLSHTCPTGRGRGRGAYDGA